MAYAVIEAGGRQIKVAKGDLVRVDRITQDLPKNKKVTFDRVLLFGDGEKVAVGTPTLEKTKVTATVVDEDRDKKVLVFKKKRRKGYRRMNGHRQWYSVVRIDKIDAKA